MTTLPFPTARRLPPSSPAFTEADQSFVKLLMDNAAQDENLIEGLMLWLTRRPMPAFSIR